MLVHVEGAKCIYRRGDGGRGTGDGGRGTGDGGRRGTVEGAHTQDPLQLHAEARRTDALHLRPPLQPTCKAPPTFCDDSRGHKGGHDEGVQAHHHQEHAIESGKR